MDEGAGEDVGGGLDSDAPGPRRWWKSVDSGAVLVLGLGFPGSIMAADLALLPVERSPIVRLLLHVLMLLTRLSEVIPEIDLAKTRQPLTLDSFARELLPPLLCYYATAVLILSPRTFSIRFALFPITLWGLFRAATQVDLVAGLPDYDRMVYLNQGLVLMITIIAIRICLWTVQQEPYRRYKSSGSKYLDAFDLCINLRGIGWSWSEGLKLPVEDRDTSSTPSFFFSTLLRFLFYAFAFDLSYYTIQSLGRDTIAAPRGGSIYETSLTSYPALARALFISGMSGSTVYLAIQTAYYFLTMVGILLLQHSPSQWPPLFDNPYKATSVFDFWARWHQLFRQVFVEFGGKPMMFLTGRVGGVLGSFFVSGVLHYLGLWGMARGSDFPAAAGYFLVQGVGVILEFMYRAVVGSRVKGPLGLVWAYSWVVVWGLFITEAWSIRGLMGSKFLPDEYRPAALLVEQVKNIWTSA